jgi:RNA polymerase sigma factor (sigma-70 family)
MDLSKDFWTDTYSRNIKKLIGICFRYVSDRQIAEDLAHDSFLIAMKKSGTFKGKGHFDAWLRKITVNTALQNLRETRNLQELQKDLLHEEFISDYETEDISQGFTRQELLEILNRLPEHHRLVFNMYVMDGFSHKQIAENLNISIGTSKSHLARAKKKLQWLLDEKQGKKKTKRSLLLFLFPNGYGKLYRFYKGNLSDWEITPKSSFLKSIDWNQVKRPVSNYFGIIKAAAAAGIIVLLTALLLLNGQKDNIEPDIIPVSQHVIDPVLVKNDTILGTQTSVDPEMPVIVKKQRIIHKQIIVRDTLIVIDSGDGK